MCVFDGARLIHDQSCLRAFPLPRGMMHDVMLQYRCSHSDGSSSSEQELSSVASDSPMKRSPSEYDDEVIVTSVGFADRQASLQAAVDFDTEKAIAD